MQFNFEFENLPGADRPVVFDSTTLLLSLQKSHTTSISTHHEDLVADGWWMV